MRKLDAALTHLTSQLLSLWLPLPSHLQEKIVCTYEPYDLHLSDWHEFIRQRLAGVSSLDCNLAWVHVCKRHFADATSYLATEIIRLLNKVRDHGGTYTTYYCSSYPVILRHIQDPPAALTALGNPLLLRRQSVAVVGSRMASRLLIKQTYLLSKTLAERNRIVVSGGARGIDAASHFGAIAAGLDVDLESYPTIAVMAGGLTSLYPRENQDLFEKMKLGRALFLSERLWDTTAKPRDFPVRNRIISGLCEQLVVMQAAERSGTLSSANLALKQGRDVFVYWPWGDEIKKFNKGSWQLIEEGAAYFRNLDFFQN